MSLGAADEEAEDEVDGQLELDEFAHVLEDGFRAGSYAIKSKKGVLGIKPVGAMKDQVDAGEK